MKEKKKVFKVKVSDGGPAFFSDTVTISHNPKKFIIDFQQMTPRFSKVGTEKPQHHMVLEHNTVMIDPDVAKEFLRILEENVKNYEKNHGNIKVKKMKKMKSKKKDEREVGYTSYIG